MSIASIADLKSKTIKLNYTDVAAITQKAEGYPAAIAVFVDAAKDGGHHKVRVVEWNDHPTDPESTVLSRLEWTVPGTIPMSESIACKQAVASQIQAGHPRHEVIKSIEEMLRSHESAAAEMAAIRKAKARLSAGKVPPVVMNTNSSTNEMATIMGMLANIASRLDKLEGNIPNELA